MSSPQGLHESELMNLAESVMPRLSSLSMQTRNRAGQKVAALLRPEDIPNFIAHFENEPYALLGWLEYCIKNQIGVSSKLVEYTFGENVSAYGSRRDILPYREGERYT
jgi:hypothetical protein